MKKIKLSYTGLLQNSLTSKQNDFFKKSLIKDWRNAMSHKIPISATFNVLNYINLTPSLNLSDRMYTNKVNRSWDEAERIERMDTVYGFYNVWDFSGLGYRSTPSVCILPAFRQARSEVQDDSLGAHSVCIV